MIKPPLPSKKTIFSHRQYYFSPPRIHRGIKVSYRITRAFIKNYMNWRKYQKELSLLHQHKGKDIVFISWPEDLTDEFNEKTYNRFVDPMIDFVKNNHSFLKLEINLGKRQNSIPRFEPSIIINIAYDSEPGLKFRRMFQNDNLVFFQNIEQLKRVILRITPYVQVREKEIMNALFILERYEAFFFEILSILRPKVVFAARIYSVKYWALIPACKKLKIKTVEIQHGRQGKYNAKYTHWTRIPSRGYDMLPDFYWTWGEESKHNIKRWHPRECSRHRPIVGGNAWLLKWIKNDKLKPNRKIETFLDSLQGIEKIILFSLQPIEDALPFHVLQSMRKSPSTWRWLIRLHPYHKEQGEKIRRLIEQQNITGFEMDYATDAPLYALLSRSDHHVTCHSSISFEALAFSVPTTIVHPHGLKLYDDYINRGIFTYAPDDDALLRSIQKGFSKEPLKEPVKYIETSCKRARKALNTILQG